MISELVSVKVDVDGEKPSVTTARPEARDVSVRNHEIPSVLSRGERREENEVTLFAAQSSQPTTSPSVSTASPTMSQ